MSADAQPMTEALAIALNRLNEIDDRETFDRAIEMAGRNASEFKRLLRAMRRRNASAVVTG